MGLSVLGRLTREEGDIELVGIAEAPVIVEPEETAGHGTAASRQDYSLLVQFLITTAIASRLAAEALKEAAKRTAHGFRKAANALGWLACDTCNAIAAPVWDIEEGVREYVGKNGAARSLAAFLWLLVRKAVTLALAAAVVVIWSMVWSTFGFSGTWQLVIKAGVIAAVFLAYVAVEYA